MFFLHFFTVRVSRADEPFPKENALSAAETGRTARVKKIDFEIFVNWAHGTSFFVPMLANTHNHVLHTQTSISDSEIYKQ